MTLIRLDYCNAMFAILFTCSSFAAVIARG